MVCGPLERQCVERLVRRPGHRRRQTRIVLRYQRLSGRSRSFALQFAWRHDGAVGASGRKRTGFADGRVLLRQLCRRQRFLLPLDAFGGDRYNYPRGLK